MEKVSSSDKSEQFSGWGWGLIIDSELSSYVVGRLCTLIESWGLPERQEKAAKDLVRQEVSEWFYPRIGGANISIPGSLNTAIRRAYERIEEVQKDNPDIRPSTPALYGDWEFEVIATRKD